MKEYLLLFRGGENPGMEGGSPEEMQAYMMKWMQWMEGLRIQDKLIASQPLETSGMKINGTHKVVSDGPYMEGKEMVGGYLICKAEDYKEAVEIASACPILEDDGNVEIREIRELKM
jgi:hypothetical protein